MSNSIYWYSSYLLCRLGWESCRSQISSHSHCRIVNILGLNYMHTLRSISSKEVLFQFGLWVLVFLFFAIDRRHPQIAWFEFITYLNYLIGSLIIGYILIPKLYYAKKYIPFIISIVLIILIVIFIEECVVEQIYFPDTKGQFFSGIFITSIDVTPVIAVLVGFKFGWDAINKQNEVDDLKELVKESELQYLKSQINPHFLFNNLNNLYSHALEQSAQTPSIILELSAVLRYMLYECKSDYVPLKNELKHLESFIRLSQMQIEGRGSVTYNFKEVDSSFQIAPLILVVFVENAFKHAQSAQSEGINIDIDLEVNEHGLLNFSCINTHAIENRAVDLNSSGIGLQNVKKRLNHIYPNLYNLTLEERDDTYTVDLKLQLNKKLA